MNGVLTGGCLCGDVTFEVKPEFKAFYLCHCKQCQQLTGSAFAANLFTEPDNIVWLKGQDKVTAYVHPTREFTQSFCSSCGSAVPAINKSGKSLIVPSGSLLQDHEAVPDANIFSTEKVCWFNDGASAKEFKAFPE
ncbi:MAG: GFA family protein [Arenicella sp.]